MRRLHDEVADSICRSTGQSFIHIVDLQSVTLFQFINDDLTGKCTAHFILRVCRSNGVFDRPDGQIPALIVAGAERYHQDRRISGSLISGGSSFGSRLFRATGTQCRDHGNDHDDSNPFFHSLRLPLDKIINRSFLRLFLILPWHSAPSIGRRLLHGTGKPICDPQILFFTNRQVS